MMLHMTLEGMEAMISLPKVNHLTLHAFYNHKEKNKMTNNLEKLICDKAETTTGGFQYCDNRECPYGVPRLNFAYGSVCTIADYRKIKEVGK